MLVLSRKAGEKILLRKRSTGEEIDLTVVRHGFYRVRLGIEAPADWDVIRGELATEPGERTSEQAAQDSIAGAAVGLPAVVSGEFSNRESSLEHEAA